LRISRAVFLHGGLLDGHDFDRVLHLAARQRYRAIAFDRPGYGLSDRPKARVTPFGQARYIRNALRARGVRRPILVGHSWSGLLTLGYALLFPEDVSGIVLVAPAMYKEGYPAEHGDPLSTLMTAPVIGGGIIRLFLKTPLAKTMTENMLRRTFAPEPVPDGYRDRVYSVWLRPGQIRANREDVLAFPPAALEAAKRYRRRLHYSYRHRPPAAFSSHASACSRDAIRPSNAAISASIKMAPKAAPGFSPCRIKSSPVR
jgi:pimeloyl-ACP methyl ester carboxylesterase